MFYLRLILMGLWFTAWQGLILIAMMYTFLDPSIEKALATAIFSIAGEVVGVCGGIILLDFNVYWARWNAKNV